MNDNGNANNNDAANSNGVRPLLTTFLKTRYIMTGTGKLVKKIPKDVVKRQRRKMRKLARLASEGTISLKDFQTQYKTWRGDKKRYHAYYTLRRLDSEEKELAEWIRNTHSTQTA